jgi:hypothetical protein
MKTHLQQFKGDEEDGEEWCKSFDHLRQLHHSNDVMGDNVYCGVDKLLDYNLS